MIIQIRDNVQYNTYIQLQYIAYIYKAYMYYSLYWCSTLAPSWWSAQHTLGVAHHIVGTVFASSWCCAYTNSLLVWHVCTLLMQHMYTLLMRHPFTHYEWPHSRNEKFNIRLILVVLTTILNQWNTRPLLGLTRPLTRSCSLHPLKMSFLSVPFIL